MRLRGPLAGSYPAAVALVVFALTPYLALSTALLPLTPSIASSVGLSKQSLELTSGMANAAYAFGTVAAVQLAVHLRGRRLLVLYASLFLVGSVLAAGAWTAGLFVAGRVLQGLCTSLMLIAAVPPLVAGWPAAKMRSTAITMNMCIFGAVALGPVIGGAQAAAGGWRTLLWVVAGLAAAALVFSLLTFEDQPPQDRSAPWDWVAQTLAGLGCASAFFGASQLATHSMTATIVLVPLLAGAAAVAALVVYEYLIPRPLMPVRALASTIPVAGIVTAVCAGAASVAIVELVQTALLTRTTPGHAGALFLPEFGGAVATALIFGAIVRTRWTPLFALAGMALLAGGAAVLTGVAGGPLVLVPIGTGLVGLGVGASVSPALFLSGFSQRSQLIQRIFALVELLRGVAAFMAAPIILHLSKTVAGPAAGTRIGIWVCLGIAAGGGLLAAYIYVLGRPGLRRPRLERWLDGEGPALESPPLGAAIRGEPTLPEPFARRSGS